MAHLQGWLMVQKLDVAVVIDDSGRDAHGVIA
jgi:hypothetical protein